MIILVGLNHVEMLQKDSNNVIASPHVCACGKSYVHSFTLRRHQRYECGNQEFNFVCDICGAQFKRNDKLTTHYHLKHKVKTVV